MQRLTSYLLCACFALLGAGVLSHLHNVSHGRTAIASLTDGGQPPMPEAPQPPDHDRHCPLHMMLSTPLMAPPSAQVLVLEPEVRWALPPASSQSASSRVPARVDCRGPPNC